MKNKFSKNLFALLLCVLTSVAAVAQDRVITGTVTDDQDAPLAGASVLVKGTKNGTTTGGDGKFSIDVPEDAEALVVSFIGFQSKEIAITPTTSYLTIALREDQEMLDDVVVIGYGTARRADVTSSIASVTSKELKDLPVSGVDQALQGKVSGVMVNNNGGQPGGGVSVRIRGISSINGNDPLYVVDGTPILSNTTSIAHDQLGGMGGQTQQSVLATLNPNDIESIDILKDASAQAIYGSLGANGVVLITTKRGGDKEGKISYDMYYGWQQVPRTLDLLNLEEYAQYHNDVVAQTIGVGSGALDSIEEFRDPSVLGEGTDWQDAIFRTGAMQNHQLSFSGGQEKTSYFFSLNYFNQEGTVIGSDFERLSGRINIDQEVRDWLKAGISANFSRSDQRVALTNGSDAVVMIGLYNSPAAPVTSVDGDYAATVSIQGYEFGNATNPVALSELRDVGAKQYKTFGNVYANIDLVDGLTLNNELNYDFQLSEQRAFQPLLLGILAPSRLREDRNSSYYWGLRNYLSYRKTFGDLHNVTATLGHEAQSSYWDNINVNRQNLVLNLQSIAAGDADNQLIGGGRGDWAMESYFARAGYTYDDRYAVTASVRRDASSAFGPENRIGYFPAASVGWTITNEDWAQNWNHLGYLKLRAGAGAVGNQSINANSYVMNIRLINVTPFGIGGVPRNIPDPSVRWESVVTYNGGVDIGAFDRRVELSVDAYRKISSGMLLQATMPSFTGLGTDWDDIWTPTVNAGQMTNTGVDLGLTTYNITKEDFSWRTNVVFSHYRNNLDALNNEDQALLRYTGYDNAFLLTRTEAGQPVGTFYGFVTDGLFRSMEELNAADQDGDGLVQGLPIDPTGTWLGDVRYKDLNNDGAITDEDVTTIGNPHPVFTYGITNTLNYMNFDLSIFLQGSYGNEILNFTRRYTESLRNSFWNQLSTVQDRYTEDNPDGSLPRYNQWHENNLRISDRYVEDGSYLRIQNVTLGYNLPAKWFEGVVSSARVYFTAQNLYTFTKYSGYDPELGSYNNDALFMNVDLGNYPNPRTFTIGANLVF